MLWAGSVVQQQQAANGIPGAGGPPDELSVDLDVQASQPESKPGSIEGDSSPPTPAAKWVPGTLQGRGIAGDPAGNGKPPPYREATAPVLPWEPANSSIAL